MDADFIRGPTVVAIVDHDLRDPNARYSLQPGRAACDLLDMRVGDFNRHECFPRTLLPCRLFEGFARLGVKNAEQTTGICVAVKLLSLFEGESALLVSGREVINPRVVFLAETESEQVPSEGRCEVLAVTEDASQDRNFAGGGFGSCRLG